MDDQPKVSYKLGDFIKFKITATSGQPVESAIQKCWATDGVLNYDLIANRYVIQFSTILINSKKYHLSCWISFECVVL